MHFIMHARGLNHASDGSLNEKVCLSFWEAGHKNILQIGEIRAEVPKRTAGLLSNLRVFLFGCLSRQTGKSSKGVVGRARLTLAENIAEQMDLEPRLMRHLFCVRITHLSH